MLSYKGVKELDQHTGHIDGHIDRATTIISNSHHPLCDQVQCVQGSQLLFVNADKIVQTVGSAPLQLQVWITE